MTHGSCYKIYEAQVTIYRMDWADHLSFVKRKFLFCFFSFPTLENSLSQLFTKRDLMSRATRGFGRVKVLQVISSSQNNIWILICKLILFIHLIASLMSTNYTKAFGNALTGKKGNTHFNLPLSRVFSSSSSSFSTQQYGH